MCRLGLCNRSNQTKKKWRSSRNQDSKKRVTAQRSARQHRLKQSKDRNGGREKEKGKKAEKLARLMMVMMMITAGISVG